MGHQSCSGITDFGMWTYNPKGHVTDEVIDTLEA